ncbi:MAG TPA: hypothetical protein VD884_09075 [Ohtaekwangia sp.]|nr:hypothetical protein [Ohtaekwangia sp.]
MKTLFTRGGILLLLISLAFSCVDPETPTCRIAQFYWEGEWHRAEYNSSGRLRALVAENSKIVFYYDALFQLTSAEIYMGDPEPFYKYEFTHGPHGIIQTDEFHPSTLGIEHNRTIYHYSGPASVDYIIHQEFGYTEELGFEIRYDIHYSGGNVKHIHGSSSFITTDYYAAKYDNKHNPFKALAATVGNNVFFPVGIHANFPVSDYDISYLNLFSKNNPIRGQYNVPGVDPSDQRFTYTYDGDIAKSLKWDNTSYGTTTSEKYAFEFECRAIKTEE